MALDHPAPIFDAEIALDRREDKAAKKPADNDDRAHRRRLERRERRDPVQRGTDQGGREPAADEAFDGLGGANRRRQLGSSEELAENILEDVADLHDDHQSRGAGAHWGTYSPASRAAAGRARS